MATPIGHGDNTIIGKSFGEKLFGGGGDDKVYGQGGNDVINGGSGDDLIGGGKGDDKLIGGNGMDTFVFKKDSGKDIITDFNTKNDVLKIAQGLNGIKKPSDVLEHASQKGKDVIINLGDGNKITLKNVDLDDLKKHPGDHFDIN